MITNTISTKASKISSINNNQPNNEYLSKEVYFIVIIGQKINLQKLSWILSKQDEIKSLSNKTTCLANNYWYSSAK